MAITSAALQAQLGTGARDPKVLMELPPYGTANQSWLIDGGHTNLGITKMVTTTASDAAATQKTTVTSKIVKANGHD
jgi:hypothetical protein